jgi:hypothetical protein
MGTSPGGDETRLISGFGEKRRCCKNSGPFALCILHHRIAPQTEQAGRIESLEPLPSLCRFQLMSVAETSQKLRSVLQISFFGGENGAVLVPGSVRRRK